MTFQRTRVVLFFVHLQASQRWSAAEIAPCTAPCFAQGQASFRGAPQVARGQLLARALVQRGIEEGAAAAGEALALANAREHSVSVWSSAPEGKIKRVGPPGMAPPYKGHRAGSASRALYRLFNVPVDLAVLATFFLLSWQAGRLPVWGFLGWLGFRDGEAQSAALARREAKLRRGPHLTWRATRQRWCRRSDATRRSMWRSAVRRWWWETSGS